jgi:nitrogen fixation-related uncharacterized protein
MKKEKLDLLISVALVAFSIILFALKIYFK